MEIYVNIDSVLMVSTPTYKTERTKHYFTFTLWVYVVLALSNYNTTYVYYIQIFLVSLQVKYDYVL